jgi:hypothetical protein
MTAYSARGRAVSIANARIGNDRSLSVHQFFRQYPSPVDEHRFRSSLYSNMGKVRAVCRPLRCERQMTSTLLAESCQWSMPSSPAFSFDPDPVLSPLARIA